MFLYVWDAFDRIAENTKRDIAQNMLENNLETALIMELTGLSEEDMKNLSDIYPEEKKISIYKEGKDLNTELDSNLILFYMIENRHSMVEKEIVENMLLHNMDAEFIEAIVNIDKTAVEQLKNDMDFENKDEAIKIAKRMILYGTSDIKYISDITEISIDEAVLLKDEILRDNNKKAKSKIK